MKTWELNYPQFFAASIAKEVGQLAVALKLAMLFIDAAPSESWRPNYTKLAGHVL